MPRASPFKGSMFLFVLLARALVVVLEIIKNNDYYYYFFFSLVFSNVYFLNSPFHILPNFVFLATRMKVIPECTRTANSQMQEVKKAFGIMTLLKLHSFMPLDGVLEPK